jgi:hypothetical protein
MKAEHTFFNCPTIASLASVAIGASCYAALVRPQFQRRSVSSRESARVWPGDEFMPQPLTQATRIVTVRIGANRVRPWLAQIGRDRDSSCSYTSLVNMVGARTKNANQVHSDSQHREVGDRVWLGDPQKLDAADYMVIARWVPGKALVLVTPRDWERIQSGKPADEMVWSFTVESLTSHRTRLIARSLGGPSVSPKQKLAHYSFWDAAPLAMQQGTLPGIEPRAETNRSLLEKWFGTEPLSGKPGSALSSAKAAHGGAL